MGLKDTLAGMAQRQDEKEQDATTLPSRIAAWNGHVDNLHKTILGFIADIDPERRIISQQRDFQAHNSVTLGPYKGKTLLLDVFGKKFEIEPFSDDYDHEPNTVHMSKVGRAERIRFLYRNDQWVLAMYQDQDIDAFMRRDKLVWNYQPLTAESFSAALDFLLTKGEAA